MPEQEIAFRIDEPVVLIGTVALLQWLCSERLLPAQGDTPGTVLVVLLACTRLLWCACLLALGRGRVALDSLPAGS